jgi:hypothetical protein
MQSDNDPVVALTDLNRTPRPNARRMLLRGSFAAPTVLTLSSGSALAATSSLRCFNNMPVAIVDSQPPSNFFQVQRWSHNGLQLVDAHQITQVAGAQGFDAGVFSTNQAAETVWFKVSDATVYVATGASPTKDGTNSVALRFERFGTDTPPKLRITGLSAGSQQSSGAGGGKVLSGSCWTSFKV